MANFCSKNSVVSGLFTKGKAFDSLRVYRALVFFFLSILFISVSYSQTYLPPAQQQTYFSPGNQQQNYMKNSAAFRQEIMRMEIHVSRGEKSLPITQVPRVEKGDVIKVKLSDEPVGGIKPDQSLYDWTFLVAFVNPNRRVVENEKGGKNKGSTKGGSDSGAVSQEIQFRKSGWYKQYSFQVPYDSQPVFFLYPKPKYREKILKVVSRNYEEVRKLGEKTVEIAGAYAKIGSFLNELQQVLYQTQYSRYSTNGGYSSYNSYHPGQNAATPFNYNLLLEQSIERMAASFNIGLPNCWRSGNSYGGYSSYGGYGNQNNFGYTVNQDLISRAQCVAQNIRLEDFDLSVSKLLQQGGILLATQLRDKYPQLAYWINIAAVAIDFIVKVFQKSPLRIVPTIVQSSDGFGTGGNQNNYAQSYAPSYNPGNSNPNSPVQPPVKISLYAESQPDMGQFVTAYPIVAHKWQAEPDQEVVSLYPPVLAEPCLHTGVNLLRSTDLTGTWAEDQFSKDYRLVMSSQNGFRKEFPLKKNAGLGGWELNITPEDLNQVPKISMTLESEIVGTRGFNEIRSPKFDLPLPLGGSYEITPESKKAFSVGGKRTVTLRNTLGSSRCLQRVVYKPSFGGQFVFEANARENGLQFSADGREVSFEVDTSAFQPGQGTLEIKAYGNDQNQMNQQQNNLPLKLYPLPPSITNVKISKGDTYAIITGDRLEQIRSARINGKRATVIGNQNNSQANSFQNQPMNQSGNLPQPNQYQQPNQYPNPAVNQPQNPAAVTSTSNAPNAASLPNVSANERILVFDDPSARQTDGNVTLELGLEDDRTFQIQQTYQAAPSRPSIVTNNRREVEAVALSATNSSNTNNANGGLSQTPTQTGKLINAPRITNLNLQSLPVFPVETSELSVKVENSLTDYDFKAENIQVETRIEGSQANNGYGAETPRASFEVLDWKNIRITFSIGEAARKMLGGRRLQFRIRDRARGDSDWYSVKQTFVRIPIVQSVRCTSEMNGLCELKGAGIDYVSQVSVDGGMSWYPQEPATLQAQPTGDGKTQAMIPLLANKKTFMIRLRDFPKEGLFVTSFAFSNSGRAGAKPSRVNSQTPAGNSNLPTPPANQPPIPNGFRNQSQPVETRKLPAKTNTKSKAGGRQ